jgi:hypothetical protein
MLAVEGNALLLNPCLDLKFSRVAVPNSAFFPRRRWHRPNRAGKRFKQGRLNHARGISELQSAESAGRLLNPHARRREVTGSLARVYTNLTVKQSQSGALALFGASEKSFGCDGWRVEIREREREMTDGNVDTPDVLAHSRLS